MDTRIFAQDTAENSIMQTITIAVSTILITAGLVAVPSSIANARDTNARTDLDNIAYAQETSLGEVGTYFELTSEGQPSDPSTPENVEYSLSGGTKDHIALVCDAPNPSYLLRATSSSDTTFYRSSGSAVTSTSISDLEVPQCIEDQVAVYDAANPTEPFYVAGSTSPAPPPEPDPVAAAPEPTPTPSPDTVGNSAGINPDGSVRPPRARR